jgi:hypothetical protein
MGAIDDVITGRDRGQQTGQFGRVYLADVTDADADTVWFVVPAIDEITEHQTSDFPIPPTAAPTEVGDHGEHTHDLRTPNNPPAGTRCAVAFADGDVGDPVILAFYGWPV